MCNIHGCGEQRRLVLVSPTDRIEDLGMQNRTSDGIDDHGGGLVRI